jgi:hypothetical protein
VIGVNSLSSHHSRGDLNDLLLSSRDRLKNMCTIITLFPIRLITESVVLDGTMNNRQHVLPEKLPAKKEVSHTSFPFRVRRKRKGSWHVGRLAHESELVRIKRIYSNKAFLRGTRFD